jgi:glycosyltransferase involved in cell wall biosynthesis
MKLLLLTQYYPPEIGAPQNRLHELAVRLKTKGVDVEVLTALPNYPEMEIFEAYQKGQNRVEEIEGIKVTRSWIYVSKKRGIVSRLFNYFSFVASSYFHGKKLGKFDYLMVESPPLFLGWSAMKLSKKLGAKLIFNVSDLWPESAEKLNIVNNRTLLNLAYRLEAKCYQKSHFVTGQTMGIVDSIQSRFPQVKTHWLPNGVDTAFYHPDTLVSNDFRERNGFQQDDILFFYGGIIGHAQGLEVILKTAQETKDRSDIHYILQGAGPLREELIGLKQTLNLSQVHFLAPVSKKEMPMILKAVDVALVPLRKLTLFEGAIPSKIFEALAMKLPLILAVDGEARMHFIERAEAGIFVEPENIHDLKQAVLTLADDLNKRKLLGENGRKYVSEHFNRNKIAQDFFDRMHDNLT